MPRWEPYGGRALFERGRVVSTTLPRRFLIGGNMYTLEDGTQVDGFISRVRLPDGKTYALQCKLIEAHPITCPKCGGTFELSFGHGRCDFCGTYFTTEFKITEV